MKLWATDVLQADTARPRMAPWRPRRGCHSEKDILCRGRGRASSSFTLWSSEGLLLSFTTRWQQRSYAEVEMGKPFTGELRGWNLKQVISPHSQHCPWHLCVKSVKLFFCLFTFLKFYFCSYLFISCFICQSVSAKKCNIHFAHTYSKARKLLLQSASGLFWTIICIT